MKSSVPSLIYDHIKILLLRFLYTIGLILGQSPLDQTNNFLECVQEPLALFIIILGNDDYPNINEAMLFLPYIFTWCLHTLLLLGWSIFPKHEGPIGEF